MERDEYLYLPSNSREYLEEFRRPLQPSVLPEATTGRSTLRPTLYEEGRARSSTSCVHVLGGTNLLASVITT